MSKLFRLKVWLTLPDAAKHLAIAFGEEVGVPDVLRLGLDGHLKLSVYFVNHATVRTGKLVSWLETEWFIGPCKDKKAMEEMAAKYAATAPAKPVKAVPPKLLEKQIEMSEIGKNDNLSIYMSSLNIDDERFLNLNEELSSLSGIWDLPMIGAEKLDIEHQYQQLTGGPAVTLQTLEGAFIEGPDGVICQLQESFDDNEYQAGSKAQLNRLKEQIATENISQAEAQVLLEKHKMDRKVFLEHRDRQNKADSYYPAGTLPQDAVIVVRTSALRKFEQSVIDTPASFEKPLTTTERNTLLTIIAALCDYSDIKYLERGAASQILKMTEVIGAPITDDTIRSALRKIPDALESRQK